jgi:hypothetical protein
VLGSAELTWEIDSLRLLSFNAYTTYSAIRSDYSLYNTYFNQEVLYNEINRGGLNKNNTGFNYFTVDYEILKNRKRDVLTLSGKLFRNSDFNSINYADRSIKYNFADTLQSEANLSGTEYTAQVDYSKFINASSTFEIGVKEIMREYETNNQVHLKQQSSLDYNQLISILYSSWTLRKKNNYFKIGIGLNHTRIAFTENAAPDKMVKEYFNPLPFINYSRNLKKNRSLSFNYSLRTRRPGVGYISSAFKYSSVENPQTGNPALKPEIVHSAAFTYNTFLYKKPLIAGLYARLSPNSIVQIMRPYQDSLALRTYINGGSYLSVGNTLYYSQKFFKKLTFRINSDVEYVRLSDTKNKVMNDGFTYKIFLTLSYTLPLNFRFSTQNFIYGRTINLQGTEENFSDLRFYLARNFLDNSLSVGISLYQPYSSRIRLESEYRDNGIRNYMYNNFPSRYIGLSVSYDFGDFSKVMKRQKNKTINNDDLR